MGFGFCYPDAKVAAGAVRPASSYQVAKAFQSAP